MGTLLKHNKNANELTGSRILCGAIDMSILLITRPSTLQNEYGSTRATDEIALDVVLANGLRNVRSGVEQSRIRNGNGLWYRSGVRSDIGLGVKEAF